MLNKEQYKEVLKELSKETGLSMTAVDKVYKAYWDVIRQHIESLPLKEDLTDDEFLGLQTSVNIPSLGKLFITLDRYKTIKQKYNQYKERANDTY